MRRKIESERIFDVARALIKVKSGRKVSFNQNLVKLRSKMKVLRRNSSAIDSSSGQDVISFVCKQSFVVKVDRDIVKLRLN
jgi:hypothetical protein